MHLTGCIDSLLNGAEVNQITDSYREVANSAIAAAKANGLTLTGVRHATLADGSEYFGIAKLNEYNNVLVAWRTSNNSRKPCQLALGYGHQPSNTIGLIAWSKPLRPSHEHAMRDRYFDGYFQTAKDLIMATSLRLRQERRTPIDTTVINAALINAVRSGLILPSKIDTAIAYIDNAEPTLWALRLAMLTTLVSPTRDYINALSERSPDIHYAIQTASRY